MTIVGRMFQTRLDLHETCIYMHAYVHAMCVFISARSQFDTNHSVNFSTPTYCQSATVVRPIFAFVLCFFTTKIIKKHKCYESVSIGVIDQVRSANDEPNALLQIILVIL